MSHKNKTHIILLEKYEIPHDHLEKHFTHAHGHGGQNVNKVATKVQIKVYLEHLNFPEEICSKLKNKFPLGHIEVACQDTRHQHENLEIALKRMKHKIENAIKK